MNYWKLLYLSLILFTSCNNIKEDSKIIENTARFELLKQYMNCLENHPRLQSLLLNEKLIIKHVDSIGVKHYGFFFEEPRLEMIYSPDLCNDFNYIEIQDTKVVNIGHGDYVLFDYSQMDSKKLDSILSKVLETNSNNLPKWIKNKEYKYLNDDALRE